MPLADGATFSGYTVVRLLGSGGMGEVYLAQTLQTTGATIWSLNPGDVPSPTVTTAEAPAPLEEESPVRVRMQQTGQTWLRCREEIRRSNLGLR